jgi:hypothetical protein
MTALRPELQPGWRSAPWACFICGRFDLDCGHWEPELRLWLIREADVMRWRQAAFERLPKPKPRKEAA